MVMARRQTLVQLTDELVDKLDELAHKEDISRSELVRRVLRDYVAREDEQEKVRRTIEGYKRIPPGTPDEWGDLDDWAEWSAREAIAEEPWE